MKRKSNLIRRLVAIGILAAFMLVGVLSFAATNSATPSKNPVKKVSAVATKTSTTKTSTKIGKISTKSTKYSKNSKSLKTKTKNTSVKSNKVYSPKIKKSAKTSASTSK